jgi:hypothetical protein
VDGAIVAQQQIRTVLEAIASGLILVLLGWIGRSLFSAIESRTSGPTGMWYVSTPEAHKTGANREFRCDLLRLKRFSGYIWGSAKRLQPTEQQGKSWRLIGRLSHSNAYGHFWTLDLRSNPRSYGTFHLQMTRLSEWSGVYSTTVVYERGMHSVVQSIATAPMRWSREPLTDPCLLYEAAEVTQTIPDQPALMPRPDDLPRDTPPTP